MSLRTRIVTAGPEDSMSGATRPAGPAGAVPPPHRPRPILGCDVEAPATTGDPPDPTVSLRVTGGGFSGGG
jgi:hypothetical protein